MKKLLVAAIGAAAAIGAFADVSTISTQRFEGKDVGSTDLATLNGADEWFDDNNSTTNQYSIEAVGNSAYVKTSMSTPPTKALAMKTKFGEPLNVNILNQGGTTNIPASGLYFDSMVKFTVCDEPPAENLYSDAKIVMWLQENQAQTETNLMVRAGYLSIENNKVAVTNKDYTCNFILDDFDINKFHRVTIKAFADITNGENVPGFAIFIDSDTEDNTYNMIVGTSTKRWADNFYGLNEAAAHFNGKGENGIFPSLMQTGATPALSSVGFDGTGSITDLAFTDEAPVEFAKNYVEPKVDFYVGAIQHSEIKSIEDAFDYIGTYEGGSSLSLKLTKGVEISDTLAVPENVTLLLDFNGCVITNRGSSAAISNSGSLTITNSNVDAIGGIFCPEVNEARADAISEEDEADVLAITGGNFWGNIVADLAGGTIRISGGAFLQEPLDFEDLEVTIADGKKISETKNSDGLYEVVDVTYTITFISGDGSTTNKYENCAKGQTVNVPTPAVVVGKTFSAWSPAIAGETVTVDDDATYTAVYETIKVDVIFVDGDTARTNGVDYGTTLTAESAPPFVGRTGYTAAWDKTVAGTTVTAETTFTAVYTANTYTVTFYTNSAEYATATYTYGDASTYSAPADPSVDGYTFGGWFTDNGTFETAFVFNKDVAANTQVAYAKLTGSGGGSDWDPVPSEIDESKTAAQEYPALADTPLATANAKKLTVWAKANGVDFGDVKSATTDIVDSYLLNCSAAELEDAKAAFAIPSITFDEDGKPVIAEPTGSYNGTIQQKGSNNLSTWTVIDGSTYEADDFQFFKLELVP